MSGGDAGESEAALGPVGGTLFVAAARTAA